jgi:hypothetical protein
MARNFAEIFGAVPFQPVFTIRQVYCRNPNSECRMSAIPNTASSPGVSFAQVPTTTRSRLKKEAVIKPSIHRGATSPHQLAPASKEPAEPIANPDSADVGINQVPSIAEPGGQIASTMPSQSERADAADQSAEVSALEKRVIDLWGQCQAKTTSVEKSSREVQLLKEEQTRAKEELERALYEYKLLYAKTGRNGRWTNFLEEHGIAPATADRWVKRHEQRLNPKPATDSGETTTGSIEKQIVALVNQTTRTVRKRLDSPESIDRFLRDLAAALKTAEPAV